LHAVETLHATSLPRQILEPIDPAVAQPADQTQGDYVSKPTAPKIETQKISHFQYLNILSLLKIHRNGQKANPI
jgi:hypothetical protein